MNYDTWKLSNPFEEKSDNFLVSSCCGDDYQENVMVCGDCGSYNIENHSGGDETLSICGDCRSVENEEYLRYVCQNCDEECGVIPLWEYNQDQKENYIEDMRD